MRTSITYWLLCAFLSTASLTEAQSLIAYADSLQETGKSDDAAIAYERAYFFAASKDEKVRALFGRAYALKKAGRHYDAYKGLARIRTLDVDDSARCAANYQLALNLFLAGYYADSETYCSRNASLPVETPEYNASVLLHGLALNALYRYEEAARKFRDYNRIAVRDPQLRAEADALVDRTYRPGYIPKVKSLKKARKLSTFLPGAGLFYAGAPGKALANIGFLVVSAGYTAANVWYQNYITAATAGLFMVRSFYTGGINQLNEVVPARNERKTNRFNERFKHEYLQLVSRAL